MAEQAKLVVARVGERTARTSSSVEIMADCGHAAWISAGGIATQARMKAVTVCTDCTDLGNVEFMITPEVYADLVKELGQAEADALIELADNPLARAQMFGGGRG